MRTRTRYLILAAALSTAGGLASAPALAGTPNLNASCNGQVSGYYSSNDMTNPGDNAAYVHTVGGRSYAQDAEAGNVTLGAHAHGDECNIPR
jgi:hypothetical protein